MGGQGTGHDKAMRTEFDFLVFFLKICNKKGLPIFESDARPLHFAVLEGWRKTLGQFVFVINNSQVTELNAPL